MDQAIELDPRGGIQKIDGRFSPTMPTCLSKVLVKASPLRPTKTARYVRFLALKAKSTRCASECSVLASNRLQGWLNIWGARLSGKRVAKIEILSIFYREYCQERMSKLAAVR
jgi:hypothetical protein